MAETKFVGPEVWGPKIWEALHYISMGYPDNPTEEQKTSYRTFIVLLKEVLPCQICANHFAENLKTNPLTDNDLRNRESFMKWMVDFHNTVNKMKNKPVVPFNKAKEKIMENFGCSTSHKNYENFSSISKVITRSYYSTLSPTVLIVTGVLVVIAAIIIIARSKNKGSDLLDILNIF